MIEKLHRKMRYYFHHCTPNNAHTNYAIVIFSDFEKEIGAYFEKKSAIVEIESTSSSYHYQQR